MSRTPGEFVPPPPPPGFVGGPQFASLPGGAGGAGRDLGFPAPAFPETSRTLQVWHPWVMPFPGSTDFRVNTVEASPGAGVISPANWSLTLPSTSKGVIKLFTWALANVTVATVVSWILKINNQPVQGWQNITVFPGNVPRVTLAEDPTIPVPFGGTISVDFVNTDGAAYNQVGAGFAGHYWDQTAEDAWIGQLRRPE